MNSRTIFAAALLTASLAAAQPLSTIQETLYKADGTRFNGTLTIAWTSFEAIDHAAILQQSTTITVLNGNLRVRLVPTTTATPAAFYSVTYNSDGRVQFSETWAVPSSVSDLRVRDVRIASSNLAAGAATLVTAIQESDVTGLISDLGARPLKGPAYAGGRVAWVSPTGALETVTGSPSDCVRVDGTSGPCGGTPPAFNDNESPAGIVDGANLSFVLSAIPNPAPSLEVHRNGVLQKVGQDFTASGNTIQFVAAAAPQPGDTLLASYRLPGGNDPTTQLYPNPEVLCSGLGAATNSATLASLGACTIPAGYLAAGDRIEIHFDIDHTGAAGAFSFEAHWGAATVMHRDAAAGDAQATARAEAALVAGGARLSHQSWGTVLSFGAGVGTAGDDYFTSGITIDFLARVAAGADSVTLRNFTVVRYP